MPDEHDGVRGLTSPDGARQVGQVLGDTLHSGYMAEGDLTHSATVGHGHHAVRRRRTRLVELNDEGLNQQHHSLDDLGIAACPTFKKVRQSTHEIAADAERLRGV